MKLTSLVAIAFLISAVPAEESWMLLALVYSPTQIHQLLNGGHWEPAYILPIMAWL